MHVLGREAVCATERSIEMLGWDKFSLLHKAGCSQAVVHHFLVCSGSECRQACEGEGEVQIGMRT